MAAGFAVAADALAILCASREVELSGFGLRNFSAGIAVVYVSAVSELVSKKGCEKGQLEGEDLFDMIFGLDSMRF